jgi:hypothetical protein
MLLHTLQSITLFSGSKDMFGTNTICSRPTHFAVAIPMHLVASTPPTHKPF